MKLVSRLHECFKLFFSFLITPLQFFYFFTFLSSSLAGIETSLFEILTILNRGFRTEILTHGLSLEHPKNYHILFKKI